MITPLTFEQIVQLEKQGCFSLEWDKIRISKDADLRLLRNVRFKGNVTIGKLEVKKNSNEGIYNAVLSDCEIGNNVYINNVGGELHAYCIGDRVKIENVGRIYSNDNSNFGQGIKINVLDETGSRPVYIYSGITSQIAALMVRNPEWTKDVLFPNLSKEIKKHPIKAVLEDDVEIIDTTAIIDVKVEKGIRIEGARHLKNGTLINNGTRENCLTYVGIGVDAENFIIEDAEVSTGATLRNVYVGQGSAIVKGFTAHDALFFANSVFENGEACAVFAGPYTVSMHKSSLLIGGCYSFMNAGSGSNSSNHQYKLGPWHWGVMQRGVKTASNSYVMWGAKIGAYSLLIGSHKYHPDTSQFPFSYVVGDAEGKTTLVPGIMLRSCGLRRDIEKWPARDKRVTYSLPQKDNIHFEVLNPVTIEAMIKAVEQIDYLEKQTNGESEYYEFSGFKIKKTSLNKGKELYKIGICKYISEKIESVDIDSIEPEEMEWIDLSGQIIPLKKVYEIIKSGNISEMTRLLKTSYNDYRYDELKWIANQIKKIDWFDMNEAKSAKVKLEEMIDEDAKKYKKIVEDENKTLLL